ncbi:MAG: hypothetical protein ACLU38_04515 [Dysosmobacter sp.]
MLFNDMNGVFADYALSADEMAKWEKIIEVRDAVNGALETARAEKKIGKSLEADVALTVPAEDALPGGDGRRCSGGPADRLPGGGHCGRRAGGFRQRGCRYQVPPLLEAQHRSGRSGLCPRCASVIAKCADFGEV